MAVNIKSNLSVNSCNYFKYFIVKTVERFMRY